MEAMELTTSIGTLSVEANARDWFILQGPFTDDEPASDDDHRRYPHVHMIFDNRSGPWEPGEGKPTYYGEAGKEAPMPQALLDELSKLAIEWADAHPEEFERAAREEFEDWIGHICHDTLDDLVAKCSEAQKNFRQILDEPEFKFHASNKLRRRVKHEAQRIRTMKQQVIGAAKAIRTLAGICLAREEALTKASKIVDPEDRAVALVGISGLSEDA